MGAEPRPGSGTPGEDGAPAGVHGVPAGVSPGAWAELMLADDAASGPGLAAEYRELLGGSPATMLREGGPRHLTASAIVVDAPGDHVALVWHLKGRFWVQPGGHLEAGETSFEQGARREVAEEIGLSDLERIGPGPAMLNRHALDSAFGRCHEHWDVQFLLRAPGPAAETPLRASEESGDVTWFPWPARTAGSTGGAGGRTGRGGLPEGTVPDLPATLDALAGYYAAHAG